MADAIENEMLDLLLQRLQAIGVAPGNWLTTPSVAEGFPGDALPSAEKPLAWIQHLMTEQRIDPETGVVMQHSFRATFAVWIVASTQRMANKVKTDVWNAVFGAEAQATTQFQQPFWPADFRYSPELSLSGKAVCSQGIYIDFDLSHA